MSTENFSEFSERLKTAIGSASVRDFAKSCGVSETAVRQYLRGESDPSRTILNAIALNSGVSVAWLATGEGPMRKGEADETGIVRIPFYVEAKKGSKGPKGQIKGAESLSLPVRLIHQWGVNSLALCALSVVGDAMENVLRERAVIIFDQAQSIPQEGIFVLRMGESMMVKRIQPLPGGQVRVKSDNPSYEAFNLRLGEEGQLMGQVVGVIHEI